MERNGGFTAIILCLWGCILTLLFNISLAKPLRNDEDITGSLQGIAGRLGAIDSKLGILTGHQDARAIVRVINSKLDSIESRLDSLVAQEGNIGPVTNQITATEPPSITEPTTTQAPKIVTENCIDLVSLERKPIVEGIKFILRYKKNRDDIIFRLSDTMGPYKVAEPMKDATGDAWSVDITPRPQPIPQGGTDVWLIIADKDYETMLSMRLNTTDTTAQQQLFPKVPFIELTPATDVAYDAGDDIQFKVQIFAENAEESVKTVDVYFSGLDLDTGKFDNFFDRQKLFNFTESPYVYLRKYSDDKVEASFTVLTSTNHVSGYMQVNHDLEETGGPLVAMLQVVRHVLIHPSNQTGAFPDGYLGMMEFSHEAQSESGNELQNCMVGIECPLQCAAVGNDVSDIGVFKVKPDGSLASVASAQSYQLVETTRAVYWTYEGDAKSGDDNGITTFKCEAHDVKHNLTASKLVEVQIIIPSVFDGNSSGVFVENDRMDPYKKILVLRCTITGRPMPEVQFNFGDLVYYESPDEVVKSNEVPNNYTAIKRVTIDDIYIDEFSTNMMESPTCEYFSVYDGFARQPLDTSRLTDDAYMYPSYGP